MGSGAGSVNGSSTGSVGGSGTVTVNRGAFFFRPPPPPPPPVRLPDVRLRDVDVVVDVTTRRLPRDVWLAATVACSSAVLEDVAPEVVFFDAAFRFRGVALRARLAFVVC